MHKTLKHKTFKNVIKIVANHVFWQIHLDLQHLKVLYKSDNILVFLIFSRISYLKRL